MPYLSTGVPAVCTYMSALYVHEWHLLCELVCLTCALAAVQIRALRAIDELIRQNNDNVLLLILEGAV
jgi:hypothetical protein